MRCPSLHENLDTVRIVIPPYPTAPPTRPVSQSCNDTSLDCTSKYMVRYITSKYQVWLTRVCDACSQSPVFRWSIPIDRYESTSRVKQPAHRVPNRNRAASATSWASPCTPVRYYQKVPDISVIPSSHFYPSWLIIWPLALGVAVVCPR